MMMPSYLRQCHYYPKGLAIWTSPTGSAGGLYVPCSGPAGLPQCAAVVIHVKVQSRSAAVMLPAASTVATCKEHTLTIVVLVA
jgi:hypothetical protein